MTDDGGVGGTVLERHAPPGLSAEGEAALARQLSRDHARRVADSIVLYAGTNQPGPAVEAALAGSMGAMPAMGRPWAKDQPGTAEISALEELVEGQLRCLFGAAWAEARLPSATLANLATYRAFCGPGRPLMATGRPQLGHASHLRDGTPALLGIEVVEIPFLTDGLTVDEASAIPLLEAVRPGLLMLGTTLALGQPYPEKLVARARALGTVVAFDISHTAGLVAGGAMRNPFELGGQLLTGSTYKSFGGPPGAFIVGTDRAHAGIVHGIACPQLASNYDAGRLVALAVACADAKRFMAEYARRMVWTADRLHACLAAEGLRPLPRPCDAGTHHLLLPVGSETDAKAAMRGLEACNVLAGTQRVPGSPGEFGLRFGTQVVARRLFDGAALAALAALLRTVLAEGPSDASRKRAVDLARAFPKVGFCLLGTPR